MSGPVDAPDPRETCVCADPSIPGTVHRTDGPCYPDETGEVEQAAMLALTAAGYTAGSAADAVHTGQVGRLVRRTLPTPDPPPAVEPPRQTNIGNVPPPGEQDPLVRDIAEAQYWIGILNRRSTADIESLAELWKRVGVLERRRRAPTATDLLALTRMLRRWR